ncbi:MAG TPA: PspA/IM30 family protein [Clostridia bacterium]|nr:PspA/IM30 family protein [Clostridia bacterium]
MGFFERFRRMIKSNLNQMISRAEDPEKMLNQLIIDMNQQLIESKKSVASAIADEKKLERLMNNALSQSRDWEEKARTAVKAGKDDLAKQALVRKQEFDSQAQQYREQYDSQHESVEKLKQALRQLQQKIEEAQRKKNLLIARSKRADTQRQIQDTIGNLGNNSAFEAFDRLTQDIEDKEAHNAAVEEMESTSSTDELEEEFAKLENSDSSADLMLEDLKQRIQDEEGKKS